jgi:tRNA(Ile)-lysidine synthase
MSRLADTAAATADAHSMFGPGTTVVAMVSGGADSVAMLRALAAGVFGPVATSVLHVDHRLRGAESDGDATFVRDLCAALGVPCRVASVDVAAFADEHGLNLEDAGRRVRYAEAACELAARLTQTRADRSLGRIATAHTQNDRAETALMRLAQGTGAGGLTSLAYRRGAIVRPLLDCTRADVLEYLGSLGQPWREDASNADTSRVRARVRSDLIPLMRAINPRFDDAVARTLALLGDEDSFLDDLARSNADGIVQTTDGEVSVDRAALLTLPRVLQRRVLRFMIRDVFEDASRLEFDHIEAVCDGLSDPAFARDMPDGLRAFAEYGRLIISRSAEHVGPFAGGVLPVPGTVDLGEAGVVSAAAGGPAEPDGDPRRAILDADSVSGPLTVTPARPGDRMRPFGMAGSRKVSDILIDAKVPARRRTRVPVVRDGERIVWVAGVKSSEEYRVGPQTLRTVRLEWEPRSSEGTT